MRIQYHHFARASQPAAGLYMKVMGRSFVGIYHQLILPSHAIFSKLEHILNILKREIKVLIINQSVL